jgi:hypothetical protein
MKSLSHRNFDTGVSSHPPNPAVQRVARHVHFDSCTTDIITNLLERNKFRFTCKNTPNSVHSRPILKYTDDMTDYLRRAGSSFARALSALGTWCTGVTSDNPNIRSDMYRQLVAQIRGFSPHLRQAGETLLQGNVQGMWFQLVDDFSMQREEYASKDILLYLSSHVNFLIIDMRMPRN